ncbi:MAG: protein phosphatase 2C domain-containing protein [Gemmatimonadota bacterium]
MVELPLDQRSASLSECGRRRVNQDAVLVEALPGGAELVVVADGMGGHSGGEIASSHALAAVRAALAADDDLVNAVRVANVAVYEKANASADFQGMGTTLVGLFRRGAKYSIVNVGDSRAYRVDAAGIRQLTEDHSFIADAMRSGTFSIEEAEKSPWRNAVTRSVGTDPDLEVDCFGPFDANEPHAVVLLTDGVYRTLSDDELWRMIISAPRPDEAVRAVVSAAFESGSDDNISVALVQFGPQPTR